MSDERIALLFLIPGVGDTFRVNGRAIITDDRELLEPCAVNGKVPARRLADHDRGGVQPLPEGNHPLDLWNPERHVERSALPTRARSFARCTRRSTPTAMTASAPVATPAAKACTEFR